MAVNQFGGSSRHAKDGEVEKRRKFRDKVLRDNDDAKNEFLTNPERILNTSLAQFEIGITNDVKAIHAHILNGVDVHELNLPMIVKSDDFDYCLKDGFTKINLLDYVSHVKNTFTKYVEDVYSDSNITQTRFVLNHIMFSKIEVFLSKVSLVPRVGELIDNDMNKETNDRKIVLDYRSLYFNDNNLNIESKISRHLRNLYYLSLILLFISKSLSYREQQFKEILQYHNLENYKNIYKSSRNETIKDEAKRYLDEIHHPSELTKNAFGELSNLVGRH